jgi:hypothetical protein
MFDKISTRPAAVCAHTTGPWTNERIRYLTHCRERGDAPETLRMKACSLLWITRAVGVNGDLH